MAFYAHYPVTGGGSGANTSLSNLVNPTNINQNLLFQSGVTIGNGGGDGFDPATIYTTDLYLSYNDTNIYQQLDKYGSQLIPNIGTVNTNFYSFLGILPFAYDNFQLISIQSGLGIWAGTSGLFTATNIPDFRLGTGSYSQTGSQRTNLVWETDGFGALGQGATRSSVVIQDITWTSTAAGTLTNGQTITYVDGGANPVSFSVDSGGNLTVSLQSGVTTGAQIVAAYVSGNIPYGQDSLFGACAAPKVTGTGSNPQTAVSAQALAGALDTGNLRPSAAYILNNVVAGGKVLTTGGLGVGNSASATVPGSVVKKIEVFDQTGASLGFIPVYSSIT